MRPPLRSVVFSCAAALSFGCLALGSAPAHAAGGVTGAAITIQHGVTLSGYDIATTPDGTTYVGWIGNDSGTREFRACVLPRGATSCRGGVLSAPVAGTTTARDLHAVVSGSQVMFVWIEQPLLSSAEFGGDFGTATVAADGTVTTGALVGAPTNGTLSDVVLSPRGSVLLAAIGSSDYVDHAYLYQVGQPTPHTFVRPYFIGNAQVADNGHQIVFTTSPYGSVTGRVSVARSATGATWSGFSAVAHSITLGGTERLQRAGSRIMLVAGSDLLYYPAYDWSWSGSSFGSPVRSGDSNDISTIDATSDASGRLATVDSEVGALVVSNFGSTRKAARFRIPVADTYAGGPAQVSTSPSGAGWVVYSVQREGTTGQFLIARPIRLSALTRTVTRHAKAGKLTLTGPASCLPAVSVGVGVKTHPAHHWKRHGHTLRLNGHRVGKAINGAALKPATRYTLKATATFVKNKSHKGKKHKVHKTVRLSLVFTTCGRP